MQTPAGSYLAALSGTRNILCCPTHERYESSLCKVNAEFYSVKHPRLKDWREDYAPIPPNYHIYDLEKGPWHETFSLALSQSKFGQFDILYPISRRMGIPLISLEHTTAEYLNPRVADQYSRMVGDVNVFIAEDQIYKWKMENSNCRIIRHCVDDFFTLGNPASERKRVILSIVNDFIGRGHLLGFNMWQRLVYGLPFTVKGDTKGFSTACSSLEELKSEYHNARIFLNTSIYSPIPSVMLEAAACGCAIVTTKTCAIPEFFEHEKNCLMSNNEKELRKYLEVLLSNDKLADELGYNAHLMIKEKCSTERFIKEWDDLLTDTYIN